MRRRHVRCGRGTYGAAPLLPGSAAARAAPRRAGAGAGGGRLGVSAGAAYRSRRPPCPPAPRRAPRSRASLRLVARNKVYPSVCTYYVALRRGRAWSARVTFAYFGLHDSVEINSVSYSYRLL